jgi:hypothetical protein
MIILKDQKFDNAFAFSKAMAVTQKTVERTIKGQILLANDGPKNELSVLIGCLEGMLRESIQQISYIKAEKKVKNKLDLELMKNDLDKLLYVLDSAHDQIDSIARKSILLKN